jgi:choline kinase
MINILIPLAGKNNYFEGSEQIYPKQLIEIENQTVIEMVINNFSTIKDKQFIFLVMEDDVKKFHIDNILRLLTDDNCQIITLRNYTHGAVCTALMAIEFINNNDELIIANSDQVFSENIYDSYLESEKSDAAILTFYSIHPKWAYAKLDDNGFVIETAEKNPISKAAIAGVYYFKYGKDFVNAAMNMIKKDANIDGIFYLAPVINELVLENKIISNICIDKKNYHIFNSPRSVREYERRLHK